MLIDLDGLRLNVVDEGEGEALLFLHGLGANHRIWQDQLDAFHGEYRCLAPDLRGSGQSDRPPGPYSVEVMGDDVADACAQLGIGKATVVGQSMGGSVAQALVVRHPELVQGLVLVGTQCEGRHGRRPSLAAMGLEEAIRRNGLAVVPAMVNDDIYPQAFQQAHPEKVWRFARELLNFDVEALIAAMNRTASTDFVAELPGVEAPTLIMVGVHDGICPPEESEYLKELMPAAELVVLDHCGHQPFYEDPDGFNALLREFLVANEQAQAVER